MIKWENYCLFLCNHFSYSFFIFPDDYPSYRIELGANWIHGTHGNPVFEIAKSQGLLHERGENRPKFQRYDWVNLTSNGETIPHNLFRDVSRSVF